MGTRAVDNNNRIVELPVEKLVAFHDHPFRLYEGDRLIEMVESIKVHGVLNPIIVRVQKRSYEILAGHNRVHAAKLAELKTVPAIVKENLSDEDAYVYVIESNMVQRSFSELLPTEKAAVLAMRYEKVICQGRRNDILDEIRGIEDSSTGVRGEHKLKTRDKLGSEFDISGSSAQRLMRLNKLIPSFKQKVDSGDMPLIVAVNLSYLPENEQNMVRDNADVKKMKKAEAIELHMMAGKLTKNKVQKVLLDKEISKQYRTVKVSDDVYNSYFAGMPGNDVTNVVELALKLWHDEMDKKLRDAYYRDLEKEKLGPEK